MIITIDGPAGAGKSTVARALAHRLGFRFLDTGATYRAVAWAAVQRGLPWDHPELLVDLAGEAKIELVGERVLIDGQDISKAIRPSEVTAVTHFAANNPGVREHLVRMQRAAAGSDDIVTEGRDQGTVVFPQAECKIFLTATPEERAKRRALELSGRGEQRSVEEVLAAQNRRDQSDATRAVGPLAAADDSIEVITDGLSLEEVVDALEAIARRQLNLPERSKPTTQAR